MTIAGLSIFWFVVLCIAVIMGLWAAFRLTMLDATERHDYLVAQRRANRRESEPPEWADAEKWWESEGWK